MTEEQNKLAGRSADPEFEHEAPETQGTWQERCAALYQVVGCMAHMFGVFESSDDVSDALDVAAGRGDVEKLLPWPKVDLCKLADREPSTEAVLEEALRGWTEWMGTECSRDWRADEARIAEIRALKGKGASQGAIRERLETDAGYAEGLLAAQAPEPSGEFVRVRKDVVEFLRGAAPLDGFWFGEKPLELQAFWWRKYLSDEQKG